MKKLIFAVAFLFMVVPMSAFAANLDAPQGFKPVDINGASKSRLHETAASQTIAKGDAVIMNSAGQIEIALSSSGTLLGVAGSAVTSSSAGDDIWVYDDPNQVFEGQCSGTYAITINSTFVDIEGTTGIMEINENASTEKVIQVLHMDPNSSVGANARVYFNIVKHQLGDLYEGTSDAADYGPGGIATDTISESTSAAGVTIDGLLLKDGQVEYADDLGAVFGDDSDLTCAYDETDDDAWECDGALVAIGDDPGGATATGDGDLIVEDAFEVDGASDFDGAVDVGAGFTNSAGELLVSGGNAQLNDSIVLSFGSDDDTACNHNDTLMTCTHAKGDWLFDNTDVDDQFIFRLGTDTSATAFQVRNDSDANILGISGNGDFAYSGHKDQQTMFHNAINIVSTADWTYGTYGAAYLAASKGPSHIVIPLPGLKEGDEITKYRLLGSVESGGNQVDIDASNRRVTKAGAGAPNEPTDAAFTNGAMTTQNLTADTAVDVETDCDDETIADDYQYYVLVTSTTLGATGLYITGVEIDVNRK